MTAILVSHFTDKAVVVAAPDVALSIRDVLCGASYNGTPAPARTEVYRYALRDADDLLSPWSDPVQVTHPAGGGVFFDHCEFVPTGANIKGIHWRIDDRIGIICEQGVGPEQFTPPLPLWSPIRPGLVTDLRKSHHVAPKAGTSKVLTSKPPKPILQAFNIPNVDLDVFYEFVTDTGVTAPSPTVRSLARSDLQAKGVTYRRFNAPGLKIPPGVRAYQVYAVIAGELWHLGRFDIDCMQPQAVRMARVSGSRPPREAVVTISAFQQALDARQSGDVVVVDVPEVRTTVPIIDRFGPVHSKVVGLHGGPWTINYTPPGAASEVALLVQSCYTIFEGMTLRGGCRATSNWAGGQAFGNKYRDCVFDDGIRTLDTSSRWWGDHTESETEFDGCVFRGRRPLRLAGNQTANIRFRRSIVVSSIGRERGTCCLWIDTPNLVVFEGGLYADFGHAFAYLGMRTNVRIDDIFLDQGTECVADCYSYYPARLRLRDGKLNAWFAVTGGTPPWICRSISSDSGVKRDDVTVQHDFPGIAFKWRTTEVAPVGPVVPAP